MACDRNGFLDNGAGKRSNTRDRGKGELHASAMMAAYLVLAVFKAAGALVAIRCVRCCALGRNVVMLDVQGMRESDPIPSKHS